MTYIFIFQDWVEEISERRAKDLLPKIIIWKPGFLFDLRDTTEGDGQNPPDPEATTPSAWCKCDNCRPMASMKENLCCGMSPERCISISEVGLVLQFLLTLNQDVCV